MISDAVSGERGCGEDSLEDPIVLNGCFPSGDIELQ